jgi:hypothetical protein
MRSTPETREQARADGRKQAEALIASGRGYCPKAADASAWFIPADVWAFVKGFEQAFGRP